jgi:hypothetical protein
MTDQARVEQLLEEIFSWSFKCLKRSNGKGSE